MAGDFDVVIVGARCAGASLAALLARQGLEVAVVEQATFPRDTLSSHTFEADALAFLDRLGLTARLRNTGAPMISRAELRMGDFSVTADLPQRSGDVGGMASIRRHLLDTILVEAAKEAGAHVYMGSEATGLLIEDGRIGGVRIERGGKEIELRAPLVVGADGRNSSVAKFCESRRYNVTSNERVIYWGYFEGAEADPTPTFRFHRWTDRLVNTLPGDSGLQVVVIAPEIAELSRFKGNHEALFEDHYKSCEPIAAVVAGARRVGKLRGAVKWEGFFRQATGPGWVLVGDAGHFKDPAPGRGIGDALLQADALAPAIVSGLDGSGGGLDTALSAWAKWRDREFAEHYWLASDMGKAGYVPAVLAEIVERLHQKGELDRFLNVLNHRAKPSEVVTPPLLLGAVTRLLASGDVPRGPMLRETGALGAIQAQRLWLNRFPAYAS